MSDNSVRFTLSAKVVKKITRDKLGYEISSNAFELLNQKAKEYLMKGFEVEEVDDWIVGMLNKFKEKKIVRRKDIEQVIGEEELEALVDENNETSEVESDDLVISDDHDKIKEIDIIQLPSMGGQVKDLEDEIERLKKIIQIILNKQAELV